MPFSRIIDPRVRIEVGIVEWAAVTELAEQVANNKTEIHSLRST